MQPRPPRSTRTDTLLPYTKRLRSPLARIRGDLVKLEDDVDARLPPARLREIQPLVQAINSLADARAGELELARHRGADLAHGLKTPLELGRASGRARVCQYV